jgi:hypothetical protein
MVALELEYPEFDILAIREYKGALEVYVSAQPVDDTPAPPEEVEVFFQALFAWVAEEMGKAVY